MSAAQPATREAAASHWLDPSAVDALPAVPQRIHILGGPGAGKSTLAQRLAGILGHPVHALDRVAYEGPHFTDRPLEDRLADVAAIAADPAWIVEGIHLGWTDELLERADLVVWLDYAGWLRVAGRIFGRSVASALGEVRKQPGVKKFTRFEDYQRNGLQLVQVLTEIREYYRPEELARRYPVTRDATERRLRAHAAKTVRCTSAEDVDATVAAMLRLAAGHGPGAPPASAGGGSQGPRLAELRWSPPRPLPGHPPLPLGDRVRTWALGTLNAAVPKDAGAIIVHSLPDFEDGALAVLDALHRRGYRPTILSEDPETAAATAHVVGRPVRTIGKNTVRGRLRFLTSGIVITTHGAIYRSHRVPRSQMVVNVWHGEPLTKPVARWDGHGAVRSTWSTALSKVGKAFRCAEFDLDPSQVLVTGSPRNDRMLTADPREIRARIPELDGARRLLTWLPTYRSRNWSERVDGQAWTGMLPLTDDETLALDRWLVANDTVLLVKPHPMSQTPEVGRYERIVHVGPTWLADRRLSLYTLLAATDCLVTDVSSVWIDFLLLDRPILYVFPDLDAYRQTRGVHLEPYEAWISGPLVKDGPALVAELDRLAAGEDSWAVERLHARTRLHAHQDARSTERLLDAVGL